MTGVTTTIALIGFGEASSVLDAGLAAQIVVDDGSERIMCYTA